MRIDKTQSDLYIESVFVNELPERLKILEDLKLNDRNGIQISACEGMMLKFFSLLISAKKIVEIGTLYGYSTSWFVESLTGKGKVWSFEKEESHFQKASEHLAQHIKEERLQIFQGDALQNLKSIEIDGPFDLIFIDANKSGYMDYFNWADKNLRSGGLIIADNTFLFGQVFEEQEPDNNKKAWKVMRELNQTIANHPNYTSAMIPTKEGLTIAFKK